MDKRIVYKNEEGGVSIIVPTLECLKSYTIEEIAAKDVPEGIPYKIVDGSDIPTDRTFRDAWEVSEDTLTDGVGSSITTFNEV